MRYVTLSSLVGRDIDVGPRPEGHLPLRAGFIQKKIHWFGRPRPANSTVASGKTPHGGPSEHSAGAPGLACIRMRALKTSRIALTLCGFCV